MNERIGQLAEQAGLLGPSSRVGNSHQATEKFAELIIKECADVAGCNGHVSGFALGDLIKEHFGVEE
jgi:hypothetical protein